MSSDTPKDRLRQSREALNLSRTALAKRLGWSASTIRAHETGQNQILPEAALAYRDALGISPSWLLYGTQEEGSGTLPGVGRLVDVVGEVWETTHFVPIDEMPTAADIDEQIAVDPGTHGPHRLYAYRVRGEGWNERRRKHHIVRRFSGLGILRLLPQLAVGDELILRVTEGRLGEVAVWKYGGLEDGHFTFFKGSSKGHASAILKLAKEPDALREHVLGVVVETQIRQALLPTDELDELEAD